jgi:hypothetical protein
MKNAQKIAKKKLKVAKESWEFKKEEIEVARLAKLLDEDNLYS